MRRLLSKSVTTQPWSDWLATFMTESLIAIPQGICQCLGTFWLSIPEETTGM